ncbi:P-loop NTPase fold protein [Labrenzia sp. ac12]
MKIFPPEPHVALYEEGFEDRDVLQRAEVGKSLTMLVERIEDPMVVALDGGWGTGKTYFLKRWVGAHTLHNEGTATTIYFDAFANDYLSDPLPSLVSTLSERFPSADKSTMQRIKAATFKFAKPLARIGVAMATFGATEALAPVGDAAVKALSAEASDALENYWAQEDGRRAAMEEFRSALAELVAVQPEEDDQPTPAGARLVFVVDELDRCRPDYALEVLEVIKHFFAIPGITFVLGVNLQTLENSVKARYGTGIDASAYLRKFINVSLALPSEIGQQHDMKDIVVVYLEHQLKEMGIPDHVANALLPHVKIVSRNNSISIRDVGKILSAVTLLNGDILQNKNYLRGWIDVMITLLVSKVIRPEIYERLLSLSFIEEDLENYFDATIQRRTYRIDDKYNEEFDRYTMSQFYSWLYLANGDNSLDNDTKRFIHGLFSEWSGGPNNPQLIPKIVQRDWLELFKAQ